MYARSLLPATFAGGSLLALVFACGETLAPAPKDERGAATTGADAGAPGEEPEEQHVDTFACGIATCTVDLQVCCLVDGGASCNSVQAGCGGSTAADGSSDADAGVPPGPTGPVLACTTYNNCKLTDDCCWSAASGSTCKDDCAPNEEQLCSLAKGDNCGIGRSCTFLSGDPLGKDVGHCTKDAPSGSSSGNHWPGW